MKTPKTQHTPGPWHRGCNGGNKIQIITIDKNDNPAGLIAEVNGLFKFAPGEKIGDEPRANAHLIAAAPDLLDAVLAWRAFWDDMPKGQLRNVVCNIGLLNEAFLKSSAAIAKAKGQA